MCLIHQEAAEPIRSCEGGASQSVRGQSSVRGQVGGGASRPRLQPGCGHRSGRPVGPEHDGIDGGCRLCRQVRLNTM